jgi:hypothetical protein
MERSTDFVVDSIDVITNMLKEGGGGQKGSNTVINSIPQEHSDYAKLIDKTYSDSRENLGNYVFKKSLKIDNTLYAPLSALGVGGLAEYLLPKALGQMVNQRVNSVARENVESGFLDYIFPMLREEISEGNYILNNGVLTQRAVSGRFVGERMHNVIGAEVVSTYVRRTRRGEYTGNIMRTGGRTFVMPTAEQVSTTDWFYKPNIPAGILGVIPFAIMYQKVLNDIKPNADSKIAARMNYYQNGSDKIFTIRGTATLEDLTHDAVLGGQAMSGDWFKSPLLEKKLDLYEKFIQENSNENDNIKITGHSLGALEMSALAERFGKRINIEYVGFGQPVFPPHRNVDVAYSFTGDPLFNENFANNHKILEKPFIKGKGDRFKQFHSTSNYY